MIYGWGKNYDPKQELLRLPKKYGKIAFPDVGLYQIASIWHVYQNGVETMDKMWHKNPIVITT